MYTLRYSNKMNRLMLNSLFIWPAEINKIVGMELCSRVNYIVMYSFNAIMHDNNNNNNNSMFVCMQYGQV